MANELELIAEALKYKVYFIYHKLDGSLRHAIGTRNLNNVPINKHPKGVRAPSPAVVTYFDLQKDEWRSFHNSAISKIVYVFK